MINTLIFNFKYFRIKDAIKFPVLISTNVRLLNLKGSVKINTKLKLGLVKIGFGDVTIFDYKNSKCLFSIKGDGVVEFNGRANIGHGSKISINEKGHVIFNNNFNMTAESTIVCSRKIIFGSDCLISWDTLIMDSDFHAIYNLYKKRINLEKEIIIGNNVWIGCRNLILKGSIIPDNSIISANTTITKTLEQTNAIYYNKNELKQKEFKNWEI